MIDYTQIARSVVPTPQDILAAAQSRRQGQIAQGLGASPVSSLVGNLAQSTFQRVTIRSQITPDYTYNPNAPTAKTSGFGEWVLKNLVRPSIVVQTPAGPVQLAPYGEPKINLFPLLVLGTLGAVGGVGYLAYKGIRNKK
jgi:hypothetical protein